MCKLLKVVLLHKLAHVGYVDRDLWYFCTFHENNNCLECCMHLLYIFHIQKVALITLRLWAKMSLMISITKFQNRLNILWLKHESKKDHNHSRNKMYQVRNTSSLANYSISNNQEIYVSGENLTCAAPFSL
jgi:hypothetical protein